MGIQFVECTHPAYAFMLEEAQRKGLPKHYTDDLYQHDRDFLTLGKPEYDFPPPDKFVWVLRECGTHIVCPTENGRMWLKAIRGTWGDEGGIYYYTWNGEQLSNVTGEDAKNFLYQLPEGRSSDVFGI